MLTVMAVVPCRIGVLSTSFNTKGIRIIQLSADIQSMSMHKAGSRTAICEVDNALRLYALSSLCLLSTTGLGKASVAIQDSLLPSPAQSVKCLFSFFPKSVTLILGRASVSHIFNRSSNVLLISILPLPPTMWTPPDLSSRVSTMRRLRKHETLVLTIRQVKDSCRRSLPQHSYPSFPCTLSTPP